MEMILSSIQDHVFGHSAPVFADLKKPILVHCLAPKTRGDDAFFSNTSHVADGCLSPRVPQNARVRREKQPALRCLHDPNFIPIPQIRPTA